MFDLTRLDAPPEGARARRAWFSEFLGLQPGLELAYAIAEALDETYGVRQLRKLADRYALQVAHG
ncbi:MAG TPA: hypothetical protein VJB16_03280 [archaeon]|nr:hypothetical protein [archaeon]